MRKLRACKNCIVLSQKFTDTLEMQHSLLVDQISQIERRAQSNHFSNLLGRDRPQTPMEIQRLEGSGNDFFIKSFFNMNDNKLENKNNSYFSKAF